MEFKDSAYSSDALDVHTDTNYFTDSAGLQLFHLLSHEGTGGSSSLVDGFHAARTLHATSAKDYAHLARTKLFYHASGNAGLSIQGQTAFPVLVHDEHTKILTQIRWNTADKAAFAVDLEAQPDELDNWYTAAR
jgi:trimethyllysine dioxygenase